MTKRYDRHAVYQRACKALEGLSLDQQEAVLVAVRAALMVDDGAVKKILAEVTHTQVRAEDREPVLGMLHMLVTGTYPKDEA